MVEYKGQTCRSCGEPIHWTKTEATGSAMPVDRDPILGGNLVLVQQGYRTIARVVPPDPATKGYVSHFVTCPNRAQHAKKHPSKAERERRAAEAAANEIIERRQGALEELADE